MIKKFVPTDAGIIILRIRPLNSHHTNTPRKHTQCILYNVGEWIQDDHTNKFRGSFYPS